MTTAMTALAWLVHVAATVLVVVGVAGLVVAGERVAAAWLAVAVGIATRTWALCLRDHTPRKGRA